jgi:hypothetical protein
MRFKLFGFGMDVYQFGIPVPPELFKYLQTNSSMLHTELLWEGPEIPDGGWRLNYKGDKWRLVAVAAYKQQRYAIDMIKQMELEKRTDRAPIDSVV